MTQVCFRMDDELKASAEALFSELGMSFSTAITVFVKQALLTRGLPFPVTAAQDSTLDRRWQDARAGRRMAFHDLVEVEDE